jgi:hypothetical protein
MDHDKALAEAATGCVECVTKGGPLWDDDGNEVSDAVARERFMNGKAVHAPNAGAGSYTAILRRLGFKWVKVEDWTSSAGDWVFRVWNRRLVFQSNRFPRHGFSYTIANMEDCQP